MLTARGIPHQVLNANHIAAEAEIVKLAGVPGRVTVSTNMAGRGTDIKLGDSVTDLGGLHVILTEMHDAARIDRQLIGRCGRQGDPGTFRQYLSLEDELLLAGLGPKRSDRLKDRGERGQKAGRLFDQLSSLFRRAADRRAPPFPPTQGADVLREGAEKDAAADGPGPVSGHAGVVGRRTCSSRFAQGVAAVAGCEASGSTVE